MRQNLGLKAKIIMLLGIVFTLTFFALIYLSFFVQQQLHAQDYVIHGFDVSHHQGQIQWQKIPKSHYQFVYIKATEGGDFVDPRFQHNWREARAAGFYVGAYHFYNLCRDGLSQAQNFIANVPKAPNSLAPVIDLEYSNGCIQQASKEQLLAQIHIMHDQLQQHYGQAPVFYVSKAFYHIVLSGSFEQTPLWVRDYQAKPQLQDGRAWLFWQHRQDGRIPGIAKAVDLNVFAGKVRDWEAYLQQIGVQPKPAQMGSQASHGTAP